LAQAFLCKVGCIIRNLVMGKVCDPANNLLLKGFPDEKDWDNTARAFLYFGGLAWCFLGVSIIADLFMAAIEKVTSKRCTKTLKNGMVVTVKVWNGTVANLTLMALGSSAPEILLSVIELMGNDFYAGELGPGTIVGSAAFNLLVIIAVCVSVIPDGESRTMKQPKVFILTGFFSVFAYLWLVVILALSSPDKIEIWEGVVTFAYFPLMVVLAYFVDIGMLGGRSPEDEAVVGVLAQAGHDLTAHEVKELQCCATTSMASRRMSVTAGSKMRPKQRPAEEIAVAFVAYAFSFAKDEAELVLLVEKRGVMAKETHVAVEYATRDGTLEAGLGHFNATRGILEIPVGQDRGEILITRTCLSEAIGKISGGSVWDTNPDANANHECYFWVELLHAVCITSKHPEIRKSGRASVTASQSPTISIEDLMKARDRTCVEIIQDLHRARATILSSEEKGNGQVRFERLAMDHIPSTDNETTAHVSVHRFNGLEGELKCKYTTESDSARSGYDYVHTEGEIVFPPGGSEQNIDIGISSKGRFESSDIFRVIIFDPPGCEAPVVVPDMSICTITIREPSSEKDAAARVVRALDRALNFDAVAEGNVQYVDQFRMAFKPHEDEELGVTAKDWTFHFVALPWKVLFAFVPPPSYFGGWLCFFCALIFIGAVTALISDLASSLGCCLGIPDSITAITIVALGTSLPDTFASKVAAVEDPTADSAIGNVTGSNSVNVFLGLGLPWMIGSIYWGSKGKTQQWKDKYTHPKFSAPHFAEGGFVVEAGDLVFSVLIFTICALIALSVIWYRRVAIEKGAELGGPTGFKLNTSIFFVLLWLFYVGCASWNVLANSPTAVTQVLAAIIGIFAVIFGMVIISGVVYMFQMYRKKALQRQKDFTHDIVMTYKSRKKPSSHEHEAMIAIQTQIKELTECISRMERNFSTQQKSSIRMPGSRATETLEPTGGQPPDLPFPTHDYVPLEFPADIEAGADVESVKAKKVKKKKEGKHGSVDKNLSVNATE